MEKSPLSPKKEPVVLSHWLGAAHGRFQSKYRGRFQSSLWYPRSTAPVVGGLQDAFSWLLQSLPELDIILVLLHPDEWTDTHIYV